MDKYIARPGVILTDICGEYILVSTKEGREDRPYVMQVNETSAFLWKHLSEWTDIKKLTEEIESVYEIDDLEEVTTAIDNFLRQMTELGYLLKEERS